MSEASVALQAHGCGGTGNGIGTLKMRMFDPYGEHSFAELTCNECGAVLDLGDDGRDAPVIREIIRSTTP